MVKPTDESRASKLYPSKMSTPTLTSEWDGCLHRAILAGANRGVALTGMTGYSFVHCLESNTRKNEKIKA